MQGAGLGAPVAGAAAEAAPLSMAAVAAFAAPILAGLAAVIGHLMSNPHKVLQKDRETALLQLFVKYQGNPYAAAQAGDVAAFSYLLPIYWYIVAGGQIDKTNPGSTFREILGDDLSQATDSLEAALQVQTGGRYFSFWNEAGCARYGLGEASYSALMGAAP